jgi:hypothetical protein
MEATERVFVGQTDVADWEHDDETGGLVHMLREDAAVHAGLWKPGQMVGKPFEVVLTSSRVCNRAHWIRSARS